MANGPLRPPGEELVSLEASVAKARQLLNSARFRGTRRRNTASTSLFSCDGSLEPLHISSHFPPETKGIGIFVGSGSLPSMLALSEVVLPIVIDRDSAILACSRMVCAAITEVSTPEEVLNSVLAQLHEEGAYEWPPDISTRLHAQLDEEVILQGRDHWSQPGNFTIAQAALRERPPVHVQVDMTDPRLAHLLQKVHVKTRLPVCFANMTNAFDPQCNSPVGLEVVRTWPFSQDAAVLYSQADVRDSLDGLVRHVLPVQTFFAQHFTPKPNE